MYGLQESAALIKRHESAHFLVFDLYGCTVSKEVGRGNTKHQLFKVDTKQKILRRLID